MKFSPQLTQQLSASRDKMLDTLPESVHSQAMDLGYELVSVLEDAVDAGVSDLVIKAVVAEIHSHLPLVLAERAQQAAKEAA